MDDLGFRYQQNKNNEVVIRHNGRLATILRNKKAVEFINKLTALSFSEQQQLMARLTGNYKRGNERQSKNHPKNK